MNYSYPLSKKINKDCLKIINLFMYPTKKQMTEWLIEHKKITYCPNKDWWKKCKFTYICDIYKLGYLYYLHYPIDELYYMNIFKEEKISFYKYLKNKKKKYFKKLK